MLQSLTLGERTKMISGADADRSVSVRGGPVGIGLFEVILDMDIE